ncbi:MAG: GAF domain-containing protein [Taibaiella sp.]|nr:GAF domain-containing protein [Taibaiella sp.]
MPSNIERLKALIAKKEGNLRLIEEHKAEYVLSTDIPLQLIKDEEKLNAELDKYRRELAELLSSEVQEGQISALQTSELVPQVDSELPFEAADSDRIRQLLMRHNQQVLGVVLNLAVRHVAPNAGTARACVYAMDPKSRQLKILSADAKAVFSDREKVMVYGSGDGIIGQAWKGWAQILDVDEYLQSEDPDTWLQQHRGYSREQARIIVESERSYLAVPIFSTKEYVQSDIVVGVLVVDSSKSARLSGFTNADIRANASYAAQQLAPFLFVDI